MKLSKSLTTVTPLSRFLALLLFITLPVLAFYFGTKISQVPKTQESVTNKQTDIYPGSYSQTHRALVQKCGDFPTEVLDITYTVRRPYLRGPEWSPDCKYVALSTFSSKTEGLYVYDKNLNVTKKIQKPRAVQDEPQFLEWTGNDLILTDMVFEDVLGRVKTRYDPSANRFVTAD